MSDFFEPPPRDAHESEPAHEWEGPANGVVPVTVPVELILAKTPEAAIYLASVSAHPAGFEFDVFVVIADRESELEPFDYDYRALARHTGEIPSGQLRLGLRFGDGSKATNTGKYFGWYEEATEAPDAPYMNDLGGEGGGEQRNWHHSFWVWPLPPPGRLEFVCEWPDAGVPLTAVELDRTAITEAALGAREIFPAD